MLLHFAELDHERIGYRNITSELLEIITPGNTAALGRIPAGILSGIFSRAKRSQNSWILWIAKTNSQKLFCII